MFLVVGTADGDQVFTLKSADQTYRLMVEEMQTGAATLSGSGDVLDEPLFLAVLPTCREAVLGARRSRGLDEQQAVSLRRLLAGGRNAWSPG